ncbi:hypothetical protein [Actinoplanes palleronii]|nr:hypothetical protein [Actinoplanes palleronii]
MTQPLRHIVEPDPAWDWTEEVDDVLVVELSWPPDALAGRLDELVASPALVAALTSGGITGFRTAGARGVYREDSFDVDPDTPPPPLTRLLVGDDPAADMSYAAHTGLSVSQRTLEILRTHCERLGS